ncbi:Beta-fructofuranosidase insoluble isoenzyme 1 [Euphorbia peplus]|nr:Beta-fructofuranosidase insoluble isoenzyme 1 [Euphorbia peplus]
MKTPPDRIPIITQLPDDVKKGWSGLQIIPRKIWLDRDGKQLLQWPIEESMNYGDTKLTFNKRHLMADRYGNSGHKCFRSRCRH